MNPLYIVWDVQFTPDSVTEKGTDEIVLFAAQEYIQAPIIEVMNHNQLHAGQTVSRAGFTTGLRFIIDITYLDSDEISIIHEKCLSFENELTGLSSVSIGELTPIPLDIRTKSRFPDIGRLMLCIDFTNGLGLRDAAKIRVAKSDQTKDTKNGLDPTAEGKGSSGALFKGGFQKILSDPWWMRTFKTREGVSKGMLKSADGGCYDLSFDLRGAKEELVDLSQGEWWSKLDENELTLSPKLIFDPTILLDSDYDPNRFYHLKIGEEKAGHLLSTVKDQEREQTGDSEISEEISYTIGRILRGRRIRKQLGVEHGLAHGIEDFIVSENAIHPWLAEEFVNCLAFFLMTRKPKFWRNGKSRIIILQPFSQGLVEALKEE